VELLSNFFGSQGTLPHGFCYQWNPALIWLHVVSDILIALAYFSIPIVLLQFVKKRRDLPFHWMFVCFAVFIAACGSTHLAEVWTLWVPSYWLSGGIKVITALASLPTAVFLVRLLPRALLLPSPAAMRAANQELQLQQASLRETEERFRQMAENIQEIFWMVDPETKDATYVSPAFEQICELPLQAIRTDPTCYRDLIHPEDRHRVLQALEVLQLTDRFDEEFRIVCPGGKVKWIRAIGFTAKDAAGRVTSLVGTAQEITTRKEIEFVLRESEDRYRDLVEHSTDLICTHSLDGRLLSVNELPVKLLGYTREELLNMPMRDFLLPEFRSQFDQSLEVLKREGSLQGHMVVLTKSGERRTWEFHNTLRTDGVRPPIVRGIAHDVTAQRRMEKALRLSEEKFSKAFLASPYSMSISSLHYDQLIEANDSFFALTGYSREECLGLPYFDLPVWNSPMDKSEILREIKDNGRIRSKQFTLQTKSAGQIVVSYSAELIELGHRTCLLSVCEDITERKRAEARLREYEKAFEGVEEMIAVVGRDFRFLLANHAFASFCGLEKEQVVGSLVSEIFDRHFFEHTVKEQLEKSFTGKVVCYEDAYPCQSAGVREVLVSHFPVEGPAGVDRLVWVLQDITDRKRAEEQVRQLSGRLLRLQDEERRKISLDLHDSTGQELVALSTMLKQLYDVIPTSKRTWRKLISECQGVADQTLCEVRTLSYLLHPPMLDEAGLADAVHHYVKGFSQRTKIAVDLDISPDFGRLPRDVELGLFRVIQESLVNIQRHSGSETATVRLIREPLKIRLQVSDTGRGIAGSIQENGISRAAMGVGIASMEERVNQVGGSLELHSNSHGTIVRVLVPAHEASH
jgi:PAS domain S-box-containing protein